MRRSSLLLIACLSLGACEMGKPTSAPATRCATAGTMCSLGKGKLGVCIVKSYAADGKPMLTCASQH